MKTVHCQWLLNSCNPAISRDIQKTFNFIARRSRNCLVKSFPKTPLYKRIGHIAHSNFEVYIILNNLLHVQKCVCVPYFICTFLQQIAITGNQVHTNTLDQKGLEQARLQTKGQIQCSIVVRQKQQICIQICINSLMAEKKQERKCA